MNLALKRRNFFLKTMKLQNLDKQKQKKKQIFILYVLPFDKLMLLFHENMNNGLLFQLYQEFWPNVFMC